GGLMMDLPAGFVPRGAEFQNEFTEAVDELHKMETGKRNFLKRGPGIRDIFAQDGVDFGLSWPNPRGSRAPVDIRRVNPYTGYATYDFDFSVEHDGDVWARYLVCMREMRESHKSVQQAVSRLKPGPVKADAPKVVLPDREAMKTHMDALIHHS